MSVLVIDAYPATRKARCKLCEDKIERGTQVLIWTSMSGGWSSSVRCCVHRKCLLKAINLGLRRREGRKQNEKEGSKKRS